MTENRWIPLAEALSMIRQPRDAFTFGDRARMANWIVDGRVRFGAAEAVAFVPEDDGGAGDAMSQLGLRREVVENWEASGDDVAAMNDFAIFDPRHVWWETGELPLDLGRLGNGARMTLYGLQISEADLRRSMAASGLPAAREQEANAANVSPRKRGRPLASDQYAGDRALIAEIVKEMADGKKFRDAVKPVLPRAERAGPGMSDESVVKRLKPKVERACNEAGIKFR